MATAPDHTMLLNPVKSKSNFKYEELFGDMHSTWRTRYTVLSDHYAIMYALTLPATIKSGSKFAKGSFSFKTLTKHDMILIQDYSGLFLKELLVSLETGEHDVYKSYSALVSKTRETSKKFARYVPKERANQLRQNEESNTIIALRRRLSSESSVEKRQGLLAELQETKRNDANGKFRNFLTKLEGNTSDMFRICRCLQEPALSLLRNTPL